MSRSVWSTGGLRYKNNTMHDFGLDWTGLDWIELDGMAWDDGMGCDCVHALHFELYRVPSCKTTRPFPHQTIGKWVPHLFVFGRGFIIFFLERGRERAILFVSLLSLDGARWPHSPAWPTSHCSLPLSVSAPSRNEEWMMREGTA